MFTAITITGNRTVPLGERSRVKCSTPVLVESIQWLEESNRVVREGMLVQELVLSITITTASTNYTCLVMSAAGERFMWSETVTITGGKLHNIVD